MTTKNTFKGAIGAWIDSELHPAGATSPSSPNSDFVSMRLNNVYKSLDYLCIAWFEINTSQPTIYTFNSGLEMIVADAKAQNPNIKLFATLAYADRILDDLKLIITTARLQAFAANIAFYLGKNGMNGFDIDWEYPTSELTPAQCAAWLNTLRQAFGTTYYISLSPATTKGLDANAVNKNCDIINLQNYSGFTFPDKFVGIGIDPSLLGFGAKFETQDGAPYQNAYQAYQQYTAGFTANGNTYPYNTICNWRLDSDDWTFEQGQQLLLSRYIKGAPFAAPFDDGVIINAQTTPTLMQSVTIWSGEVVDAIQTSNQNKGGTYVVGMLQHGGDTGRPNPAIILSNGLTQFSYATGWWYDYSVIVQITINGKSYPSTISRSVSGQETTKVSAPAGKTIVAFSGTTQRVRLAGQGYTWVLSAINAVFG